MANVVQFPRKARPFPVPMPGDELMNPAGLLMDLNATYDAVVDAVKGDPVRSERLRAAARTFIYDIARIGGLPPH